MAANTRPGGSRSAANTSGSDMSGHNTSSSSNESSTAAQKAPDNHGACVSGLANNHSRSGEAHGDAVSAAARSNCGKPSSATNKGTTSSNQSSSNQSSNDHTTKHPTR